MPASALSRKLWSSMRSNRRLGVQALAGLRPKPARTVETVEAKQLSKVRWTNIKSLGIKRTHAPCIGHGGVKEMREALTDMVAADSKLKGENAWLQRFQGSWTTERKMRIMTDFESYLKQAKPSDESWSRLFIDTLILRLSQLHKDQVNSHLNYTLSAAPGKSDISLKKDLRCSELMKRLKNPTQFSHRRHKLALTGNVDYAIDGFRSGELKAKNFNGRSDGQPSSLDRTILEAEESSTSRPDVLFLIEAKSLKDSRKLEGHTPQVLAQALIAMKKTGKTGIAWCLTNGCEWIFGILWKTKTSRSRRRHRSQKPAVPELQYRSFRVAPLWDRAVGLCDHKQMETQLETVWWLLNLWTFTDPRILRSEFLTRPFSRAQAEGEAQSTEL